MDQIFAIRNIEGAIRDPESGDADLTSTEQRVVTVLRMFATEFENDADDGTLDAWTAVDDDRAERLIVLTADANDARARVRDLLDETTDDADDVTFSVERVRSDHRGDSGSGPTATRFCHRRHRPHHPLMSYS